ncbi:tetratricopeptide repeat protein [Wolbachia endosymbiont (group E) of Neria commutata]|uniref:tetratricopeptide repeat protein n=1 Tax=Wolbachia endosymbiont (group E) of Neria commutata TaxID=3066149 RepID=UPI0031332A91
MFTSNPGPSWQRPVVPIRQQNADAARLKISELSRQLKIAKSHYTHDSDPDRQQTAIPLVIALRDFAEGWGKFGKYQEQDKDRIKSYTKQKEILETALAISRKGADHEKIAKMLRKWGEPNYSLKGFDKNNLDEKWVNSTETVKTLHKLGNVHYRLKDLYGEKESSENLKKAKGYYEEALNVRLETAEMLYEFVNDYYSSNHPKVKEYYEKIVNIDKNMQLETANMLHELINANYDLKNPEEVKKCDEKVLEISKRIICVPEAEMADILNNLGSIYHALGDYPKAQEAFERVLPVFEELNGSGDIKVGLVSRNMGRVYLDYEDPQKTEDLQKVKDPQKAEELQKARDLQKIENLQKAKESFEKALPIYKDVYGSEHIEVGITLNVLGSVFYSLAGLQKENEAKESYKKAKDLHESALHIYKKFYGSYDVAVTKVSGNLDRDYYALQNLQEAQKSYEKELIIYKKDLASKERDNPNSIEVAEALCNLGDTYYNLDDFQDAIGSYKKELKIREQYHGSDVVKIAKALGNLGDVYHPLGDYNKAKESFKRALAIEEKHYGSDDPIMVKTSEKLKKTNVALIKQLKKTLAEQKTNYPTGHLQIGQTLRNLGDAYGELKDYQSQKESLEEALPILKKYLGDVNPTIQKVLEGLADAYNGLEDTQKAQALYKKAAAVESECQKIALGVKNRNKPNSTLDSTSAHAASHPRSFF